MVAGDVDDRIQDLRGVRGLRGRGEARRGHRAVQGDGFSFARHCELNLEYLLAVNGCH